MERRVIRIGLAVRPGAPRPITALFRDSVSRVIRDLDDASGANVLHLRNRMQKLDRITRNPEVMAAKPCIPGMRVTVGTARWA